MRKVGHARPTGAHATCGGSTQRSPPGLGYPLSLLLIRSQRPRRLIVTERVIAVVDRRIAIDHRPHEHRVGGAAPLVLDREQRLAAVEIDDVAEAVLVLI